MGTVTEIHDYLRLLFASVGVPHCPQCGNVIRPQTVQQMVDRILRVANARRPLCPQRGKKEYSWRRWRRAPAR